MRLDIVNASVVNGDGQSLSEQTSLIIEDGFITDVPSVAYIPYNAYADRVIDAQGALVIPGLINIHAHGITFGPFFPYAWKKLSETRTLNNLNTHLLQGTTTLLNNDGLALPAEVEAANKLHPINIRTCTLHTPLNLKAADVSAGDGIEQKHREFDAVEAVRLGAVALGEVGSPGTTYAAYEKGLSIGKLVPVPQARLLDLAVLSGNKQTVRDVLRQTGLEELGLEGAEELVRRTSIEPLEACRAAILDSVRQCQKLGIPVLAHAEPTTKDAILQTAHGLGSQLIAVHVNHNFEVDEALEVARKLKQHGARVEVITADAFGARQLDRTPEVTFALLREGLVDAISTDFSGGYHDPILLVLQRAIEAEVLSLPAAVRLATSAPAALIPGLAPNRGLLKPGAVADVCIVDRDDVSRVRYVLISGRVVVEEGQLVGS